MRSVPAPFPWQSRLYPTSPAASGLSVETWNPMAKAWDRPPSAPRWPVDHRAAAERWVALANAEQAARHGGAAAAV